MMPSQNTIFDFEKPLGTPTSESGDATQGGQAKKTGDLTIESNERYATHLQFLWEQYNKLMGLGVLAAGLTIGFLLKEVVFNTGFQALVKPLKLDVWWLSNSLVCSGVAALSFIISRWCSQIVMERQIYGKYQDAMNYFRVTLDDETILPTALQPKPYMWFFKRKTLLAIVGHLNELAKYAGILSMLFSWFCIFQYIWPIIESLR